MNLGASTRYSSRDFVKYLWGYLLAPVPILILTAGIRHPELSRINQSLLILLIGLDFEERGKDLDSFV